MSMIKNYQHKVASHCESGSLRNLLEFAGLSLSEPLVFGIGSGVVFSYLFFARGVGGFPICAIRLPMTAIFKNVAKSCQINMNMKKYQSTDQALMQANQMLEQGRPVACCVDMFYMKYLPSFMHVHAPFHFIVLMGHDEQGYYVSDPYYKEVGYLKTEDLRLAWETHALFAKDNLLAYIIDVPEKKAVNWKKAVKKSIARTCTNMLIQPVMRNIFPLFGVNGIKFFAREIIKWPDKYKGLALREGMLFTPTILEEQGTGGGAFRLIYSAFLQEAASIFQSDDLKEIALQMSENGRKWRDASRAMIKAAKEIPLKKLEAEEWLVKNKSSLKDNLGEISRQFIDRADHEQALFKQLKRINQTFPV